MSSLLIVRYRKLVRFGMLLLGLMNCPMGNCTLMIPTLVDESGYTQRIRSQRVVSSMSIVRDRNSVRSLVLLKY